jgi:hypothetical protein
MDSAASRTLVLGENNVAFGIGNHSIVGFDVTSGSPVFSFRTAIDQQTGLLAATADSGLLALQFNAPFGLPREIDALLQFGGSGAQLPSTALPSGPTSASVFDMNTLLAIDGTGEGEMLAGSIAIDPNAVWPDPSAEPQQRRSPPPLQITSEQTSEHSSEQR